MPCRQVRREGWEKLAARFTDKRVTSAISGICRFGARIGYEGVRESRTIHPNLSTAQADTNLVTANIATELMKSRLLVYPNKDRLPIPFTVSPLKLTDKADGSKRELHHLSYPTTDSSSINAGIPEHYGTITYSGIGEAIQAIQDMGKDCILVKRVFESAFHHIPVSLLESLLLGFQWENTYYAESFLPFGLRTASY